MTLGVCKIFVANLAISAGLMFHQMDREVGSIWAGRGELLLISEVLIPITLMLWFKRRMWVYNDALLSSMGPLIVEGEGSHGIC